MELKFIRDSVGREIDFVVVRNGKPLFGVECKTGEGGLSRRRSRLAEAIRWLPRSVQESESP